MTKEELSVLLHSCCDTVSDSETDMESQNKYPRIVYWSYIWEDVAASGNGYADLRTYQVSIWGKVPPDNNPVVLSVREAMQSAGLHPQIRHEYVTADQAFHSYFSVEVLEG